MDATPNAAAQVTIDLPRVAVLSQVLVEDLGIQTESRGVLMEMLIVKSTPTGAPVPQETQD